MPEETTFPYRIGPKYIPDFCRTPEEMKVWLDKHLATSKVVFTKGVIELRLFKKSATINIFFVTLSEGAIDYVMELHKMTSSKEPISELPDSLAKRLCYQASVWRSTELGEEDQTFVKTVFWKYLVSDTRTVVSDSAQSDAGEKFWENRIFEALKNPAYGVHGLFCEKKHETLEITGSLPLLRAAQMKQFYTEAENYDGYFMRIAIIKI